VCAGQLQPGKIQGQNSQYMMAAAPQPDNTAHTVRSTRAARKKSVWAHLQSTRSSHPSHGSSDLPLGQTRRIVRPRKIWSHWGQKLRQPRAGASPEQSRSCFTGQHSTIGRPVSIFARPGGRAVFSARLRSSFMRNLLADSNSQTATSMERKANSQS